METLKRIAAFLLNGTVCPHCGVIGRAGKLQGASTRIGVWKCYDCRKPFTVKVGTIFESSHIKLHLWLQAIFLIASSKKGISSNQLSRTLGITLAKSIEPEVQYVGAIMGSTHEWNKGAKPPYLVVRELNTNELVKCSYARSDYSKVAALFNEENAVVTVQGLMTYNRISGKSEITMAREFDVAPDFTAEDFDKFFGADPDFTGDLSTDEFIRRSRDDDEYSSW